MFRDVSRHHRGPATRRGTRPAPTERVASRRALLTALLTLALGACSTAPSAPPVAPGPGRVTRVDGEAARAAVAAGALLLDVRTPAEFAQGHIEGARNVPLDQLDQQVAMLPREVPVVVYCASGRRSDAAARRLATAGFDARDLGGIGRW